jgi:3-hydroxybutyryl-CoA dehydratase
MNHDVIAVGTPLPTLQRGIPRVPQKPFDDYHVGETFDSYARTITETDIVNFTCFAGLKLPIFIDEEFCKKHSPFKTRIAPGFMTCSIAAGMLEDIVGPYTIANVGLDKFRFTTPVKAGDTIHITVVIQEKRDTRNPERGVLTFVTRVINQHQQQVLEFTSSNLMRKAPF